MNRRFAYIGCLLATLALLLVSCENEGLRSIMVVESFNGGNPFYSDVITDNLEVPEDWIPVVFANFAVIRSPVMTDVGDYVITGYRVEYTRSDGNPAVPPPFYAATSVLVPSGKKVEVTVLIVPAGYKSQPPLDALQTGPGEIIATANFTFYGHDVGSDRETSFTASTVLTFCNFIDEQ